MQHSFSFIFSSSSMFATIFSSVSFSHCVLCVVCCCIFLCEQHANQYQPQVDGHLPPVIGAAPQAQSTPGGPVMFAPGPGH
jgi:hypothetical protein